MTRFAAILLIISSCHLAAVDVNFIGTWMATDIVPIEKPKDGANDKTSGKMSMHCPPGFMVIEFGDGTMRTTVSLLNRPPKVQNLTYTVQRKSADAVLIAIIDPTGKEAQKTIEITQDGQGLALLGDDAITKVVPYDAAAIAAEQKRLEEAKRPADPLLDQPLSGRINDTEWIPIQARRSAFQFDQKGERISIDVTLDKPAGYKPSTQPSLIIEVPTRVGEFPLSTSFNITVHSPPSKNTVVMNGLLVVYKVTDTMIEFGLTARGKDGVVFNGKMTADVSPLKGN